MRVRPDSVFVSSIFLTIALLFFVRPALWFYGASTAGPALERLDIGWQEASRADHRFGVASVAIILIGLIVVWTGYARRSRPAWFVMLVIVWFWTFPVFIVPAAASLTRGAIYATFPELIYDAISGPGMTTEIVRSLLMFLLMVIALVLPLGRIFIARKAYEPLHLPSRRFVVPLLIGLPIAALAFYCWLRVGVLYEIPTAQVSAFQLPPPPPPPPTWNKSPDGN